MRHLYLGDPHCTVANLKETEDLMQFVYLTANAYKIDELVILGDLMHQMAIVRVEVSSFWNRWLETLSNSTNFKTIVLCGNHDMANRQRDSLHALEPFKRLQNKNFKIIDKPVAEGGFTYLPYIHDNQEFITSANILADTGSKVLVCHGEFEGSQYENGYYAPHGVDSSQLKHDLIISGHVHKRSRFGKVIHPGTARWLTTSDANQEKGLWLVDFDENGKIIHEEFIDTSNVCTPIISLIWKENEEMPIFPENAKVSIELVGSSEFISKKKALLKGKCSIKSKVTDKNMKQNRQTGSCLIDFIQNIYETKNRETLLKYMKEVGLV